MLLLRGEIAGRGSGQGQGVPRAAARRGDGDEDEEAAGGVGSWLSLRRGAADWFPFVLLSWNGLRLRVSFAAAVLWFGRWWTRSGEVCIQGPADLGYSVPKVSPKCATELKKKNCEMVVMLGAEGKAFHRIPVIIRQ
jgi:hypothetical protein